jgi:hypothetical protein
MTLCLDPKHAEAAVLVVERDALYDAGAHPYQRARWM